VGACAEYGLFAEGLLMIFMAVGMLTAGGLSAEQTARNKYKENEH
jgi:hypothetical protein